MAPEPLATQLSPPGSPDRSAVDVYLSPKVDEFDIEDEQPRYQLSFLNGLSLVVNLQIGSGIFASPSHIILLVISPGNALLVWLFAGILAWTGAGSYAELGSSIPVNGGTQAYIDRAFGPLCSFVYTWTAALLLKPGSMAIIAIVFGDYLLGAMGVPPGSIVAKFAGIAGVLATCVLNICSAKLGASTGTFFFILKLCLLGFLFLATIIRIAGHGIEGELKNKLFSSVSVTSYSSALYAGLWAYDGWDNVNFVGGELKNPVRQIPKIVSTAMTVVITCYLLANLSYFAVLDRELIIKGGTVAANLMVRALGIWAALVCSLLIAASCFGSINATTFSGARMVQAAAEARLAPKIFEKVSKDGTPVNALIFQALITCVYIIFGGFGSLVSVYGAAGYTFFMIAVMGLLKLRFTEPNLARPYKVWLVTPIVFITVCAFLVLNTAVAEPLKTLFLALFVLAGIPLYYARIWLSSHHHAS